MASTWGARSGDPRYDRFRTGLTFAEARQIFRGPRDDTDPKARHHAFRRKGILGAWHAFKLELFRRAFPDTPL